jgi:predicted small metal-binding protein
MSENEKEVKVMKYSITCPAPCNHEIKVEAQNDDEGISKLVVAAKIHAKEAHPGMSMSDQEMKDMVRASMKKG